jgi:hypothetical protein
MLESSLIIEDRSDSVDFGSCSCANAGLKFESTAIDSYEPDALQRVSGTFSRLYEPTDFSRRVFSWSNRRICSRYINEFLLAHVKIVQTNKQHQVERK